MSAFKRLHPVAGLAVAALCTAAMANPITPVSQVRTISGHSTASGSIGDFDSGHQQTDAPEGEFGQWVGMLPIPGPVSGTSSQEGGFNGVDTITLSAFTMNMGGGGGPGSAGSGEVRNEFTYTFTVGQGATYTFNLNVGCAGPGSPPGTTCLWSLSASLSSASGDELRFETGEQTGYQLTVMDATGTLNAGTYTLSLVGTGDVSFVAEETGNGWGGGAGGATPVMSLHVEGGETPACPADLGMAGGVPGQDGQLNNNDFIAFITYFFNQDSHADVGIAGGLPGHDGAFDNNDFIAFINYFFAGC